MVSMRRHTAPRGSRGQGAVAQLHGTLRAGHARFTGRREARLDGAHEGPATRRRAMTETTATPESPTPSRPRRRWLRRAAVASALVVVAGVGLAMLAHGHGRWHRGGFMGGPVDPARLDEHVDRMLKHLYVE